LIAQRVEGIKTKEINKLIMSKIIYHQEFDSGEQVFQNPDHITSCPTSPLQ
jgi:hypothetical protein